MTKKDYEIIAYTINLHKGSFKNKRQLRSFVHSLSRLFVVDNPRFDEAIFVEAIYDPYFWTKKIRTKFLTQPRIIP